jgi:hypothetical protein
VAQAAPSGFLPQEPPLQLLPGAQSPASVQLDLQSEPLQT